MEQIDTTTEKPTAGFEKRLLSTTIRRTQLLRLAMQGLNATDAAKVLGIPKEDARAHYRDPDFRRAVLAKVEAAFETVDANYVNKRKSLHEMIEEQAYRSCEDLIYMVENEDLHPSVKVKIHQSFLDRAEDSAQISKRAHSIAPQDLQAAAKAAEEMDKVIPFKKLA